MTTDQPTSELDNLPIISTRLLDAPRETVFRAFSDGQVLARWWGPNGFTNTFHEFDFRPGGTWHYVMHGPDGENYELTNQFTEITPPSLIRFQHLQSGHGFELTVALEEEAGRTRITWTMQFESAEEAERVRGFVAGANEQNLDRLEAQLASMA